MIYEFRTYTLHPGKTAAYLDLVENVGLPARGDSCGTCMGYWTAEFGMLNQVWHLWRYDSLNDRARLRAQLTQNARWTTEFVPNVQPLLMRQDIRFLSPVKDVNPPKSPGGVYELRIYRMHPGKAGGWAQAFRDIMPVREKYSRNVGIWTGEAPQPNEVAHMWHYPDLNTRMASRVTAFRDPDWLGFVAKNSGAIIEMQSTLLLPTSFSLLN
jgi:hypothetical protein